MNKNLLPIGTIVELTNSVNKVIISGFMIKAESSSSKIFDYIGYPYPQGFINRDFNLLFNHDQINSICYLGYISEEEKKFKQELFNSM